MSYTSIIIGGEDRMLKSIKLDNYTTFINPTTIDFSATNYKFLDENIGTDKILKGCLFVGENASGKSQILKSIKLLLDLFFSNNDIDLKLYKSFYTKKNNYKLEYDFVVDSKNIEYIAELNKEGFVLEELYLEGKAIIKRMKNTAKFLINEDSHEYEISSKLSFVRRAYFDTHFYDDVLLNKWFDFLRNSIFVDCPNRKIYGHEASGLQVYNYFEKENVSGFNEFLKKIDYRQSAKFDNEDFLYGDISFITSDNSKELSFKKEGTDIFIPAQFESTGNRTLVSLYPPLVKALQNDCMLILDDFGSGFHNELEECFIKYFFHYAKNSQLFFTSHSTNLLNNTILRPDQIYSVNFDGKNGSVIKRFSEEMPRESQNVEKMYLNGVFDEVPRYNKKFED